MTENKFVGSLILRTIDIAQLRNSPFPPVIDSYKCGDYFANDNYVTW